MFILFKYLFCKCKGGIDSIGIVEKVFDVENTAHFEYSVPKIVNCSEILSILKKLVLKSSLNTASFFKFYLGDLRIVLFVSFEMAALVVRQEISKRQIEISVF